MGLGVRLTVPDRQRSVLARPTTLTPWQELASIHGMHCVGNGLLVDYVSKQTLSSPFSANDLVQWKKAGVPEPVMAAALQRAP